MWMFFYIVIYGGKLGYFYSSDYLINVSVLGFNGIRVIDSF